MTDTHWEWCEVCLKPHISLRMGESVKIGDVVADYIPALFCILIPMNSILSQFLFSSSMSKAVVFSKIDHKIYVYTLYKHLSYKYHIDIPTVTSKINS